MADTLRSLGPVVDDRAQVIILGTMPGSESLRRQQYYANPRNQFWRIIYSIFDSEQGLSYDEKVAFLKRNRIALWDVLETCEREGSLDSAIIQEVANDLDSLIKQFPGINHIFFNGKKAGKLFDKLRKNGTLVTMPCKVLPSTSPAYTISIESKISEWKVIKDRLDRPS